MRLNFWGQNLILITGELQPKNSTLVFLRLLKSKGRIFQDGCNKSSYLWKSQKIPNSNFGGINYSGEFLICYRYHLKNNWGHKFYNNWGLFNCGDFQAKRCWGIIDYDNSYLKVEFSFYWFTYLFATSFFVLNCRKTKVIQTKSQENYLWQNGYQREECQCLGRFWNLFFPLWHLFALLYYYVISSIDLSVISQKPLKILIPSPKNTQKKKSSYT